MVNKKIILPLIAALALIMAVAGVFAMNAKKEIIGTNVDTYGWFVFNSGSETDPNNYSPGTPPDCDGENAMCAIYAKTTDGTHPVLDLNSAGTQVVMGSNVQTIQRKE